MTTNKTNNPVTVGIIIPSTTRGKIIKSVLELPLVDIFFKNLVKTYNTNKSNLNCRVYVGYDFDDPIYINDENRNIIINFVNTLDNQLSIRFIKFPENIEKGHLTRMWNILCEVAYDENCDYIYHCGDDIEFLTENWLMSSIELLKKNNDFGISGPIVSNHSILLTHALFPRKHVEILGKLFDEEIKNWYIDDWYNLLYSPNNVFVDFNHLCNNNVQNIGEDGNYKIIDISIEDIIKNANSYKYKLKEYIDNNN